jgi:hypothetical protein
MGDGGIPQMQISCVEYWKCVGSAGREFTPDASNRLFLLNERTGAMNWYNYVACFFAGAFLANFVPHFVHGISGDRFPTPFAHPPGRGLSSPTLNVAWAFLNLLVGCTLYKVGHVSNEAYATLVLLFCGAVAISTILSFRFAQKIRE